MTTSKSLDCTFFDVVMRGNSSEIESFIGKVNFSSFYCHKALYNALNILIDLSIYQNADAVEVIVGNGVDVNQIQKNGDSYLHKVARYLEYEIVDVFIKHGMDITIKNNAGKTALDIAKSTTMTQYNKHSWKHNDSTSMLAFMNTQIDQQKTIQILENAAGCYFINVIVGGNHTEIESFVDQVDLNLFSCAGNYFNAMELIMLSANLNAAAIEVLLKNKANINKQFHNNYTYLHMAAAYEAYEVVDVLINHGMDVMLKSHVNTTALEIARSTSVKKIDENNWLYDYGSIKIPMVFTNLTIDKQKTIMVIRKTVECRFYDELISADPIKITMFKNQLNFNSFYCQGGKYDAMSVIFNSPNLNAAAVEIIARNKFNINKTLPDGNSYLHKAAFFELYEIVDVLIKSGIDITLINKENKTALDIANITNVAQIEQSCFNQNFWQYDHISLFYFMNTSVDKQKTIEVLLEATILANNSIHEKSFWNSLWEYWFET